VPSAFRRMFFRVVGAFRGEPSVGGVPCIRDLRMPVATVVAMVAEGMTEDEILGAHPSLEREDIREALRYAAEAVKERALPLKGA
jgi:uncharacterized protein (DUF433 family)